MSTTAKSNISFVMRIKLCLALNLCLTITIIFRGRRPRGYRDPPGAKPVDSAVIPVLIKKNFKGSV